MVEFTHHSNSIDFKNELSLYFKGDDEKLDNINSEKRRSYNRYIYQQADI